LVYMTLYRRYLVTISSLEVDSISKVTATFPDAAAPLRAWLYVSIHTTASRAASATYTRARRGHDTAVQRAHSGNLQSIMQSRGSSGVRSGDDRVDLDVWESVRVTMLNGRGVGVPAAALRSPVAHARSHMRAQPRRGTHPTPTPRVRPSRPSPGYAIAMDLAQAIGQPARPSDHLLLRSTRSPRTYDDTASESMPASTARPAHIQACQDQTYLSAGTCRRVQVRTRTRSI
jgi:hypothetical protein